MIKILTRHDFCFFPPIGLFGLKPRTKEVAIFFFSLENVSDVSFNLPHAIQLKTLPDALFLTFIFFSLFFLCFFAKN